MQSEVDDIQGIHVVQNTAWERGIGSSIREVMRSLLERTSDVPAVLIALVDQPLITADRIVQLIRHFEKSDRPVCASSYSGTVGPPVVVARQFFPALLLLPDAQGAKKVWMDHPESLELFACEDGAFDIDTPADLKRLGELNAQE